MVQIHFKYTSHYRVFQTSFFPQVHSSSFWGIQRWSQTRLNILISFLPARNYLKTFKGGTREASWDTRCPSHPDRGRHTATGCGLDSNSSHPLSATWYMVTHSSKWAKLVRSGAYINDVMLAVITKSHYQLKVVM